MKKMVVIGLDGACWELIDPWLEQGDLPNLEYLKRNSVWGDSLSQLPPVTCPNWKCYSTGKNPAKLGVFWWKRPDAKARRMVSYDSRTFEGLDYFDYLGKAGLRVGVINLPSTYPPKEVNGFLITGGPDCASNGYTYPAQLQIEIESKYGYRVHPSRAVSTHEDVERSIEEILELIALRFRVALDKLDEIDFLHVTTFYSNVLQHFFYRGEATRRAWKIIDKNIGLLLERDVNLVILSDHGIHPIDTVFYINSWLQSEGYLTLAGTHVRGLRKIGFTKERVIRLAQLLRLKNLLEKVVPRKLRGAVPYSDGTIAVHATADQLDWDKSRALGSGQGTLYLLIPPGDPSYESVRTEIRGKLEELKDPRTGRKIADRVYRKEELYSGEHLDIAPDIVFEQARGVYTLSVLGKDDIFTPPQKWEAENWRYGLWLAHGEEVRKGVRAEGTRIVDIAPTVLHWMGQPVPDDMDGRVLDQIFKQGSEPAGREVKVQTSVSDKTWSTRETDEDQEVMDRLRGLGYLEQ